MKLSIEVVRNLMKTKRKKKMNMVEKNSTHPKEKDDYFEYEEILFSN